MRVARLKKKKKKKKVYWEIQLCWVIYHSYIATAAVFSQRTAADNFDPSVAIKDFTVQHPALSSRSDTFGMKKKFSSGN